MNKLVFAAALAVAAAVSSSAETRAEKLRARFDSRDTNYVFVVLHRADWRRHPENSVSAIKGAIEMGGDMVEIDVCRTKDGRYVLSHDGKLDRTTDRTGAIKDLTFEEVRAARLRERSGGAGAALTDERIPTLEEALEACRDRILVNIDRFNSDPSGIAAVIKRLGVERQVVLKGYGDYGSISKRTGDPWRHVVDREFVYMPIMTAGKKPDAIGNIRRAFAEWDKAPYIPPAYEICIPADPPVALFDDMRASPNRPRIWINTLWDSLAHDHSESLRGADFTPDRVWGWCLDLGATMIQTDRPADLIRYLESKGRHTLDR
ncbi:MAG: glycerophosphodiester phosphodiesterase family protein [Kiritimatiellae bacterium]|nr:glycerophosphodiester phosphodiesterase family protein [Kiritimatiellia bacterium]